MAETGQTTCPIARFIYKPGLQGKKELVNFTLCLDQKIEPGRETLFETNSSLEFLTFSGLGRIWEKKCII